MSPRRLLFGQTLSEGRWGHKILLFLSLTNMSLHIKKYSWLVHNCWSYSAHKWMNEHIKGMIALCSNFVRDNTKAYCCCRCVTWSGWVSVCRWQSWTKLTLPIRSTHLPSRWLKVSECMSAPVSRYCTLLQLTWLVHLNVITRVSGLNVRCSRQSLWLQLVPVAVMLDCCCSGSDEVYLTPCSRHHNKVM